MLGKIVEDDRTVTMTFKDLDGFLDEGVKHDVTLYIDDTPCRYH